MENPDKWAQFIFTVLKLHFFKVHQSIKNTVGVSQELDSLF